MGRSCRCICGEPTAWMKRVRGCTGLGGQHQRYGRIVGSATGAGGTGRIVSDGGPAGGKLKAGSDCPDRSASASANPALCGSIRPKPNGRAPGHSSCVRNATKTSAISRLRRLNPRIESHRKSFRQGGGASGHLRRAPGSVPKPVIH